MTDLKQKLLSVLDKWDESESEDYLTTEQTEFAIALIDILCQQRAALEYCANDTGILHSPVSTAKQALAATNEALKRMGCETRAIHAAFMVGNTC